MTISGASTPLSASSTLAASIPLLKKASSVFEQATQNANAPASNIIETIASRAQSSSTVFVYDLAEQVGFGSLTRSWAESGSESGDGGALARVVGLQTRPGAGLSLAGRLSQGSSKDAARGTVLTAYTTPTGLATMAHSLSAVPPATPTSRLVLQVPTVTPFGENFAFTPSLASLNPVISLLPTTFTIFLSATPQESVDLAAISYRLPNTHVVHLFDHYSSSREVGHDVAVSPALPTELDRELDVKGALAQMGYNFFDYAGDKEAKVVIVVLNGPLALAVKAFAKHVPGLGVVVVRVLRPWDEAALRSVVPETAEHVYVFDDVPSDSTQSSVYLDVFASLLDPINGSPRVHSHRVTPARLQDYLTKPSVTLSPFLSKLSPVFSSIPISIDATSTKKLLFFNTPASPLAVLPQVVEDGFLLNRTIRARRVTDYDAFSKPGGISVDRLLLSPRDSANDHTPVSLLLPLGGEGKGQADFLAVLDQSILKSHSVLTSAKPGAPVLVVTSWSAVELVSNLPLDTLTFIRDHDLRVCTLDAKELASQVVGEAESTQDVIQNLLIYLAFLRLYLGQAATESVVGKVARATFGESVQGVDIVKLNARAWAGLVEVELPASLEVDEKPRTLKSFEFNAIAVETDESETVVNGAKLGSWHDAAKHIIFASPFSVADDVPQNELYPSNPALRPEIPDRTYLVTCMVNRRLTPLEYDRNVFHLEFDTSGTGLKYEIGEALGIHGWNDKQDVLNFCRWYGVDPNRLITIPVPSAEGKMHTRTVFQALQQQIDLFGKPPKSFYSDLAEHATSQTDKMTLQFIGSAEGSSMFKKLSEKDTVTFADVLRRYDSARPGIEVLCELVGDIKPRHYSIASSQAVVGDRVDLLVVSVEWATPSGSPRYGQCTRYLADLKPGQKVTVSIKASVMKLPPDNMQPLIMAGLGTGAAPFRAFLQYRAWLASQNIPIGPIYYYFGSRHQSQEYLYGEGIEAFILDKTITKAGLAFSRDGPKKVYIQHKMLEDAEALATMLKDQNGVFYLCGPTWPVPDVYNALVDALAEYKGIEATEAGEFLESLKEEERYVLEVY